MEYRDSEKINIRNVTRIKTKKLIFSQHSGIIDATQGKIMAEKSCVDEDGIADCVEEVHRKSPLEYMEENINNEVAYVAKNQDGNGYCASDDIDDIIVKEEVIEELELDIKRDPSDVQMIGNGCKMNHVQSKFEPPEDDSIDPLEEDNDSFVNPDDLRSYEENTSSENPSTTQCAIEGTTPKDCFSWCNNCSKAFYRGFTYDKTLQSKRLMKINWKCSERNRGCCAEIYVFLHSNFFLELEGHTCRPEEGNSPLVSDEVSMTEQRCTSPPPRILYRNNVLTRYVPLKKVVSFLDRVTIPDIDPTESSTIAYYFIGVRHTVAVYMGHEYNVNKRPAHLILHCAHMSCPGLLRVLRPNKAIAKIHDHTCDTNADSIALPGYSIKDQVFSDLPVDIPDDTLAYYHKVISGSRRNVVLYRHHHYVYSTWSNPHYVWTCQHPSCQAALKIFKNNKAVLLVGHHSCQKLSVEDLDRATGLDKTFHPVKVLEYTNYDVNDDADSQVEKLHRRNVMHHMGYKYASRKWDKFYSCWTCVDKSCSATIRILSGQKEIIDVGQHTCLGNVTVNARKPRKEQDWDKKIAKVVVFLKADDQRFIYHLGYLYKFHTDHEWLCIHQDALGCRAGLKFNPDQSDLPMSTSRHNCFPRSRDIVNLMVFERHIIPGYYAYFSGYVYKRFRMLYELHQVYKWVCTTAGCQGVLTTKFNEVVAESTHMCRTDEECRGEAECIVLSDDSDAESAHKKIKTE